MDEKLKKYFTRKRSFALITVIIMILNMFSPYGTLINTSYAASTRGEDEPYFVLKILPIDDINEVPDSEDWQNDATWDYYYEFGQDQVDTPQESKTHKITMQLIIRGGIKVNTGCIKFWFDNTKLIPAYEAKKRVNGKNQYYMEEADVFDDFGESAWSNNMDMTYDKESSTIRMDGSNSTPIKDGFEAVTLTFILAEGITMEDLTTDIIRLVPDLGLASGLDIFYYPYENDQIQAQVSGKNYLEFEGFQQNEEKVITNIEVKSDMTKNKYDDGEDLDFEGAEIEITYDGGQKEQMTLKEAIEKGLVDVNQEKAVAGKDNSKVTITGGDSVTAELDYKVVTEIRIDKDPTDTTYKHGESIDFSGGEVTLVYDDESEDKIDMKTGIENGIFTPSTDTAQVDNETITLDYKDGSLSDQFDITVYDPITKIEMANNPTDTEYSHQDPIDTTGGKLRITRRSGKIEFVELNDNRVSTDEENADIDKCTGKYDIDGGQAGTQTITVTYTEQDEDNEDVKETTSFTILVNDTIKSIKVTKQPNAKNKWGTELNNLDLSGAELTVTTLSGHEYTTPVTVGMLTEDDYESETLEPQKITVKYNKFSTQEEADKLEIELKDYVASIEIKKNGDLTESYGTKIEQADFINEVKYIEHYASGTKNEQENSITYNMVQGYIGEPSADKFNTNHEYKENLTLSVTSNDEFRTELTANFEITIKDVVTGIEVAKKPTQLVYEYGDTFNAAGGRVKFHWASGAEDTGYGILMTEDSITISYAEDINNTKITELRPAASDFTDGVAKKTLQVTYRDEYGTDRHGYTGVDGLEVKATFEITIKDILSSIEVKGDPKSDFEYGDELELGDGVTVEVTYQSGAKREVDIEDVEIVDATTGAQITTSPGQEEYDHLESPNQLTKNVKIKYEEGNNSVESNSYDITIKDTVQSIAVTKPPTDIEYEVNEAPWKLTGGEVTLTRKSGRLEVLDLSSDELKIQDITEITNAPGPSKPVKVTYHDDLNNTDHDTTFNVNVNDTLQSVSIDGDLEKSDYEWGDELDLAGLVFKQKYSSQEVTVDYETIKGKVTIKDITNGEEEEFNTKLQPTADEFKDGSDKITKKLKVTYTEDGGITASKEITITIADKVEEIHMGTKPGKLTYNVGDKQWDLSAPLEENDDKKADIVVTYKSGRSKKVELTTDMIPALETLTGTESTEVTVTVKYKPNPDKEEQFTTSFTIKVENAITDIVITNKGVKTEYNHGDELDYSGIEIHVKRAGDPEGSEGELVSVESTMVKDITGIAEGTWSSGETPTTQLQERDYNIDNYKAERTLKVYYQKEGVSEELTFTITVYNIVDRIEIDEQNQPTSSYNVGDAPVYDGKIKIHRKAGNIVEKDIEQSMVSDLTTDTTGTRNAKVKYSEQGANGTVEKETQYSYTVTDELQQVKIKNDPITTVYKWGETLKLEEFQFVNIFGNNREEIANLEEIEADHIRIVEVKEGSEEEFSKVLEIPKEDFIDDSDSIQKTIKIIYEVDGKKDEKQYQITINDYVDSIDMGTRPDKKKYNLNEDKWDLEATKEHGEKGTADIVVHYKSGRTKTEPLTEQMLPELDTLTNQAGENKKVKVKYQKGDEVIEKELFDITVVDGITGIQIDTSEFETEYNYGDTVDFSQIKIKITRASGQVDTIPATAEMVKDTTSGSETVTTELDSTVFGSEHKATRTLTITYTPTEADNYSQNKTDTVQITIYDIVERIEFETQPKSTYELREDQKETPDGKIKIFRKSNKTADSDEIKEIQKEWVKGIDTSTAGKQKPAYVEYKEAGKKGQDITVQKSFTYDVTDDITDIKITGEMEKTTYNYGDNLELNGLKLTTEYQVSDPYVRDLEKGEVKIFEVKDGHETPLTEPLQPTEEEFNGTDTVNKKIKIKYHSDDPEKDIEKEIDITIKDVIDEIHVSTMPDKTTYNVGETDWNLTADDGKAEITVTYKSGRAEVVEMEDSMLTPLSDLTTQEGNNKQVTVTYKEHTTQFEINVENGITGVTIEGTMQNTKYNYGEPVDYTGLSIKVTKADGTFETKSIELTTKKDITDGLEEDVTTELAEDKFQGSEHTATRQIKITYTTEDGQKAEKQIEITVKNIIDHITIDESEKPKTDYDLHEEITYPIGKIVIYRAANKTVSSEKVSITEPMVSGLSTDTAGKNKTATVTYKENDAREQELQEQTTYQYNVNDKLNGVTVEGKPTKDHYDYGDELELDGLKIQSNYESGDVDVDYTDENITITDVTDPESPKPLDMQPSPEEFDDNDEVKKKVKVKYEEDGQTSEAEFEITIKNNKVSIEMHEYPEDTDYNVNDSVYKLDAATGKGTDGKADIKVTYQAGNYKIVALDADGVELTKLSTLTTTTGQKTVTVKYGQDKEGQDLTTNFTINVEDGVTGVEIEGDLLNKAYNYAEPLNYNGITIYVKHGSDAPGSKGTVVNINQAKVTDITDGESSAPDATTSLSEDKFEHTTHIATRTIRISYRADSTHEAHKDFTITVLNTLDHIDIATSPNTSYQLNDSTDNAGGTINIYRSAAPQKVSETKAIENSMITNLSTSQIGTFEATVTYEEPDAHEVTISKTVDYNYTVSDTVQSIELDPEPTKKDYLYGDKLDLKDGRLKVTKKNGTIEYVDLTDLPAGSITGFNGSPDPETVTFPYQETITVTYGNLENGEPAKVTFTVTINDYVKDIILTPPNKKEYQYGERQLDLIGGSVQAVMASGKTTSPVGLDNGEVQLSQFDPEAIGSQEIKVTYKGITKSFFVTIIDEITSIKIKETPKQDYKYGEKLDVKGGTIEVTTKSGRVQDIPITESMVKGYDPNKLGEQELTVTYEGQTTTYTVEVKDYVAKIEIVKPNKLVYNIGETMNLAGGKVIVIMASGITKSPIDMTSDMISGFDTSTEGSKRITVTYEGMKATFSITVVDPLSDVVIKTLPNKTEYKYGEKLDLTGGTIELRKQSGATQTVPMNESMVSGYNPNKLGTQTLTVTYEGQFVGTFDVEVKDYVSKLIVTPPSKTKYEYGENIDLKGGYVSIVMASGAVEEKVPMTSSMISGYNSTKEGIQNIQVEYKGLQGSFQVTVVDEIKGIEMNTNPDKVDYKYGQKLNVAGATIKVHKSSGTYIVSVTDDMVSGYNAKQPGTQSITVKYGGFETNFAVTVAKKPASAPKPSTPKPSTPEVQEPTVQEPEVQEPQVQEPEVQKPTVQEPEKPTEVLGVQDENKGDSGKVLAGCMCIIGLLFLLILIVFKRNVKVYVFEDGEYVLGGRDKITKKDPSLDIDKFLDGDTYANPVKIVLSDSISEKLDGKVIEIKHRGKTIKHTVKYNDEEYEFILE